MPGRFGTTDTEDSVLASTKTSRNVAACGDSESLETPTAGGAGAAGVFGLTRSTEGGMKLRTPMWLAIVSASAGAVQLGCNGAAPAAEPSIGIGYLVRAAVAAPNAVPKCAPPWPERSPT